MKLTMPLIILFVLLNFFIQAQVSEYFGSFATEWDSEVTSSVITNEREVIYGGGYGRWGYITLVNSRGKIIWEQRIESEYGANCESLVLDEMGQLYALIQFRRSVKIGNIAIDLNRFENATMLLKVKPGGDYVKGDYLVMEGVRAQKMVYNKNIGFVISILFRHNINFIDGKEYKGSMDEILVVNFSRQLNLKWVSHLPGNGENSVSAMDIDENGGIYLAGKGLGNISFTGEKLAYTSSGFSNSFSYITKLDHFGKVKWAHILNDGGTIEVSAIKSSSHGQVYLSGSYKGNFSYGGAKANSTNELAPFLLVLNPSGKVAIHQLFGSSVHEGWITDLAVVGGKIVATGNFFREIVFGDNKLQSDEPEDAWRLQTNGFLIEWSPFQNQVELYHYSSDNDINLLGVNAAKEQIIVYGSLAGSLIIDKSKKYTTSNMNFSGFFHLKDGVTKEDKTVSNAIFIISDEETIIDLGVIEESSDGQSTNGQSTGEITHLQPIERNTNNILIIEKGAELIFAIIDDFGEIVTLGGVHEDYGVIAFEENSAELKEGPKKQPLAVINGEVITISDRPEDDHEDERNDEPTHDSMPENEDPPSNTEKIIPPPSTPEDAEIPELNDALEYCLSIPDLSNWEVYVCLAESGMAEIYSVRDKYEKIQSELENELQQKHGNLSLTDIPEQKRIEIENDMKEAMLKSRELDSVKFVEFDDIRERYTCWLNTLINIGKKASVPIFGSHFIEPSATTVNFHWDKYSLFTGPTVVFRTSVGNFTKEKVGVGLTCRSQSALEVAIYDNKGKQIGSKYAFLTWEGVKNLGELRFGLRILDNKKMAKIVQTDVYYRNSFKCASEEDGEDVVTTSKLNTPDFVPHYNFNRNRALWLALMAGIEEFNSVTTEGFSILGKIAWSKYTKDYTGLSANIVNLITWGGSTLAEPYFEIINNRSKILDFLKDNREKIDFAANAGEILYLGTQGRRVMDINSEKLQQLLSEYLVVHQPKVLMD